VSDQHRIDIAGRHAQAIEPAGHLSRAESGVDQQAGRTGLDQEGVSTAAAAQRSETHRKSVSGYFSCS
jgi:hypothetical protein